ncbi:hypothetical protein ACFLR8_04390, partial [Bacteroidota bacterium]
MQKHFQAMIFPSPKPLIVFFLYGISSLLTTTAQSPKVNGANRPDFSSYIQEKHGIDQELINGILYFDRYNRVLHHPYYSGEKSLPGSIVLSGISYDEVQFNYDIHSQYLVLDY